MKTSIKNNVENSITNTYCKAKVKSPVIDSNLSILLTYPTACVYFEDQSPLVKRL